MLEECRKSPASTLLELFLQILGRGEKAPTPTLAILLRKQPALLRADFVVTKDPKWPYEGRFCGKIDREGSCSKAAGVPS